MNSFRKYDCKTCQKHTIAIQCKWCDNLGSDDDDDDEEPSIENPSMYCISCTCECWNCNIRGCHKCVDVVCCDCCVSMCKDCAYTDIQCGCYGKCCVCEGDVDRGSDGWPCYDCKKWYCGNCRYVNNSCKECNPPDDDVNKVTG